jgi:hypothetical protein
MSSALKVVADALGGSSPTVTRIPAFSNLPEDVQEEVRSILAPCQRAGLQMEMDPVIPDTVGILLENRLFRVSVTTNRATGALAVLIMGPDLKAWDREMFLALVPDTQETVAPPIVLSQPMAIRRSQTEVLEDVLAELRDIKTLLSAR